MCSLTILIGRLKYLTNLNLEFKSNIFCSSNNRNSIDELKAREKKVICLNPTEKDEDYLIISIDDPN